MQAWNEESFPFIGGGYASPLVGHGSAGHVLAQPLKVVDPCTGSFVAKVFFAGEATNEGPGMTVHAAMQTGVRAASQVEVMLKNATD